MVWKKCACCDARWDMDMTKIQTCGMCGTVRFPEPRPWPPAELDPRLIHDAVLPEVVGDYEAAEA